MKIKKYESQDCNEVIHLFFNTVHITNAKDYTKAQLKAWAPKNIDKETWNQSLLKHYSLVAVENKMIIGFGDIDDTGYLDRLYIHHEYQGLDIATQIVNKLE